MLNLLGMLKCIKRGDLYQVQGYYAFLHGSCHLILTDAFLVQKDLTKGANTFLTPLPTLPARCSFRPLTLPDFGLTPNMWKVQEEEDTVSVTFTRCTVTLVLSILPILFRGGVDSHCAAALIDRIQIAVRGFGQGH